MTNKNVFQIATFAILLATTGCTSSDTNSAGASDLNAGQSFNFLSGINVSDATPEQCPGGGKVYAIYIDANANGHEDLSETPITEQTVCNGINGTNGSNGTNGTNGTNGVDGFNALIATTRVSTNYDACPSGAGLQISYGLDANRDNTLGALEIADTKILCDGKNGEVGSQGPAGLNGHSIVFASTPASVESCPQGGTTTVMALDIYDTGVYSALDPNQSSMTICNGINGTNGSNGTNGQNAVLPAYTPVDVIMPCGNTAAYKEILLRLNNGQVLASFSDDKNGKNTRLSLLTDGSYVTTDATSCNFSLSTSGSTRSISWSNAVQKSWSL